MPDTLTGIASCTHLNDLLRALGGVGGLLSPVDRGLKAFTPPAVGWRGYPATGRSARLRTVRAQAWAASTPFTLKCSAKNEACSSCSWK